MRIKLKNQAMHQISKKHSDATGRLSDTMLVLDQRDKLALCQSDDNKGWIFYGVDKDGLSDGGFRYPTLDCAKYGIKNQHHISWACPPLDFGWESNASDREYDINTLFLLHELFNGDAILVDDTKREHNQLTLIINESPEAELHELVQHIDPVIDQHKPPALLS